MQEKRITDDLEDRIVCRVPPVEDVIPEIKPCKIPYNGGIVYCSASKAINCPDYIIQLAKQRQKYRGIED
jgi:hypothetical protein